MLSSGAVFSGEHDLKYWSFEVPSPTIQLSHNHEFMGSISRPFQLTTLKD